MQSYFLFLTASLILQYWDLQKVKLKPQYTW